MTSRTAVAILAFSSCCGCATEGWRARPPRVESALASLEPEVVSVRLDNGLEVRVVPDARLNSIGVAMAFLAGSTVDPPDRSGLATVTVRSLLEGAGTRNGPELSRAFDALGSTPAARVHYLGSSIRFEVLPAQIETALALLADVAMRPALTDAGVREVLAVLNHDLTAAEGSANRIGRDELQRQLFGAQHPYAQRPDGDRAALKKMSPDDVRRFYRSWIGPNTSAVVLAGPVTAEQARGWVQASFGAWQGTVQIPPRPLPPVQTLPGEPVLVPKADMTQTHIVFGRLGVPMDHPDAVPLQLASSSYSGQLFWDLREEQQMTYEASAFSSADPVSGVISGSSLVRSNATGQAVQAAFTDMRKARDAFIHRADYRLQAYARARRSLLTRTFRQFGNVNALADAAVALFWFGLPNDWYPREAERLRHCRIDAVTDVFTRYFEPEMMHVVLVGDPAVLAAQAGAIKTAR